MHLMLKANYIPTVERFFCSGCLTTRKIPPPSYGKITTVCPVCEQLVVESWADMVTFLATTCSAMCSGVEPEPPIKETASHEELGRWIHKLSTAMMTLWTKQFISFEAALAANVPGFT